MVLLYKLRLYGRYLTYSSLTEQGIDVKVVAAHDLTHEDVAGTSAVFSAGGDGTFLQVSNELGAVLKLC